MFSYWFALQLLFYIPNVVYSYDLEMSIIKHFCLDSIEIELENTVNVKF